MREVDVIGVRVEMPSNQPIVLLREVAGERYLPIWIGAVEATAIAFAQQGVVPPRPLTHDLLKNILDETGNPRSEEHTSELQSLMRISYAVFCLKKKKNSDTETKRKHNTTVKNQYQKHKKAYTVQQEYNVTYKK